MLSSFLSALISGEVKQYASHIRNATVVNVLAVIAVVIGIGFGIGAGYIALAQQIGPLYTSIWFAAGFIVAGVILLMINKMRTRAWKRRRRAERGQEIRALATTALIAALPSLMKSRTGMIGLLLPLIGLVAFKIYEENRGSDENDPD